MMLQERLSALLEPLVADLGYELVHMELQAQGRSSLLRLYIDKPEGVDLGDCERVSREASAALDVADLFAGSYRLEISSPGLDRPLVKPAHFVRYAGCRIRVQTKLPIDGRRRFLGVLKALDGDNVLMEVDGKAYSLPLGQIEKARIVPEFDG